MPSKYFGPGWEDDPSWRDKMDGVKANLQRGQYFVPATMNTGGKILTNAPNARAFIRKSPEDLNVGLVSNVGDAATPNPGVTGPGGSRLFGNRNMVTAPGRTPTMFTNEPGNRSLRERQLMTGTGSGAQRSALMAEVTGLRASRENAARRKDTQDFAIKLKSTPELIKGETARDVAGIKNEGLFGVTRMKEDGQMTRLTVAGEQRAKQMAQAHANNLEKIRLESGLDEESQARLANLEAENTLKQAEAEGGIEYRMMVAEEMLKESFRKTKTTKVGDTTVVETEESTPTGTPPSALPGNQYKTPADPFGVASPAGQSSYPNPEMQKFEPGYRGIDDDQNSVDDHVVFTPPNSDTEYNVNDMANFVAKFEYKAKSDRPEDKAWVDRRRAEYAKQSVYFKAWKQKLLEAE